MFGPWQFQETAVLYNATVEVFGGGSNTTPAPASAPSPAVAPAPAPGGPDANVTNVTLLLRRERPKLVLDGRGWPTHLFNGVCPIGSHMQGPGDPGGHCYTMVQRVVWQRPNVSEARGGAGREVDEAIAERR
jgi:hypothetical protein